MQVEMEGGVYADADAMDVGEAQVEKIDDAEEGVQIDNEDGDAHIDNYIEEDEVEDTPTAMRMLVVDSPRAVRGAARKRSISLIEEDPPCRNLRPRSSAGAGTYTNVEKFEKDEQSQARRNLRPRTFVGVGIYTEPSPLVVDDEDFVEDEEIEGILESPPEPTLHPRRSVRGSVANEVDVDEEEITNAAEPRPHRTRRPPRSIPLVDLAALSVNPVDDAEESRPTRTLRPRSSSAITVDTKDGIVEMEAARRERANSERAKSERMAAYDIGRVIDYRPGYHTATNLPVFGDEGGYDRYDIVSLA